MFKTVYTVSSNSCRLLSISDNIKNIITGFGVERLKKEIQAVKKKSRFYALSAVKC
jgi:hypothetical protein